MKKNMMYLAVAACMAIVGVNLMKKTSRDLHIKNDFAVDVRVDYTENGKNRSEVIKPGETFIGGNGMIRLYSSMSNGWTELRYKYPRPADAKKSINMSDIKNAAKAEHITAQDYYTRKGHIGDINILFEKIPAFAD